MKILDNMTKLIARFYNGLDKDTKIAIMNASSLLLSGLFNLLVIDLTNYKATVSNNYINLFIVFTIALLGILLNIIQQRFVELGTSMLAIEGDKTTIKKLNKKIDDTVKVKNLSK